LSLGDVGRNGGGRTSHLAGEAVALVWWETFGEPIHNDDEIQTSLPNGQISIGEDAPGVTL